MSLQFNNELISQSFSSQFGEENHLVYGWEHCKYDRFGDIVSKIENKHEVSNGKKINGKTIGLMEGKFKSKNSTMRELCKNNLTHVLFKNYKRYCKGKEVIPIHFCMDIAGNSYPSTSETVLSREPGLNGLITHKELRRLFRMILFFESYTDPNYDKVKEGFLKKLREDIIRFIKIEESGGEYTEVQRIQALWETSDWMDEWKKREGSSDKPPKAKESSWRDELKNQVDLVNNTLSGEES